MTRSHTYGSIACFVLLAMLCFSFKGKGQGIIETTSQKKDARFNLSVALGGYMTQLDQSFKSPSLDVTPLISYTPRSKAFFIETGIGYRYYRYKYEIWPGPGFYIKGMYEKPNLYVEHIHAIVTPISIGRQFNFRGTTVSVQFGYLSTLINPTLNYNSAINSHYLEFLRKAQLGSFMTQIGVLFPKLKPLDSVRFTAERNAHFQIKTWQYFIGLQAKFRILWKHRDVY